MVGFILVSVFVCYHLNIKEEIKKDYMISMQQVSELRNKTDCPMMQCKKSGGISRR